MRKILIVLICFVFLNLISYAKVKDVEFQCSYITAGTDIHVQLKPMILKDDNKLYVDGKAIGRTVQFDKEASMIEFFLDDGSSIVFDLKKLLSVHSFQVDGSPIYSYGTCQRK